MRPQQYAKAIVGAVMAALAALAGYLVPGSKAAVAVAVALAAVTSLSAVFLTPNTPKDQGGHTETVLMLEVATFIIVVLVALRVFSVI